MTVYPSFAELQDAYRDQSYLIEVGRDLMRIRDIDTLFRKILDISRQITGADAGSIFICDTVNDTPIIRFKYSHTVSKYLPYEEFVLPRTMRSIAGYVSLTGKTLRIDDVYYLSGSEPYDFNRSFDQIHGYRTKSMLAVPMVNYEGAVIGVIQLINSKENPVDLGKDPDTVILNDYADFEARVVPFRERYIALMEAIASQAAIAYENSRMMATIETQFEQFVNAAVEAVETRDPSTSGHSFRVAQYSVAIADQLNKQRRLSSDSAGFINLKEIRYAGILHDFGKIYIDPAIFQKAKKLYPSDLTLLRLRHKYLRQSLDYSILDKSRAAGRKIHEASEDDRAKAQQSLLGLLKDIEALNEPTVMAEDPESILSFIQTEAPSNILGIEGESIPILTEEEIFNLRTKRGSLNVFERAQIEKHVVYSYEFVKRIPWPNEYANIPEYILNHHEFLDGSGYPNQRTSESIPIQSRILTVADIYDALTAADRPYKKAIPQQRAFAILYDESCQGKLDRCIVDCLASLLKSS